MSTLDNVRALEALHIVPTYKRQPVVFVRGAGMYLYDADGKAYLDMLSGIGVAARGHADPALTAAIAEQAATLMHVSNLYFHPLQGEAAQRLSALSGRIACGARGSGGTGRSPALALRAGQGREFGLRQQRVLRQGDRDVHQALDQAGHGAQIVPPGHAHGNPANVRGQHLRGFKFASVGIVTIKFTKLSIVAVNHGARFDICISKADSHVVLQNRITFKNLFRCNFVARRYLTAASKALTRHFCTNANINASYDNIIIRMEADDWADEAFFRNFNHGFLSVR